MSREHKPNPSDTRTPPRSAYTVEHSSFYFVLRTSLRQAAERFVEANSLVDRSSSQRVRGAVGGLQLLLRHWFIPEDVTPDYYHFTFWRMFQRFVAGTINVFGTQVNFCAGAVHVIQ